MIGNRSLRPMAGVLFAAVLIVAAGGAAIASNMGFKMNRVLDFQAPVLNQQGDNWVSVPLHNPYGNFGGLCTQLGLPSALGSRARITKIDQATNSPTSADCGTSAANAVPMPTDGSAVRIRTFGVCSNAPATLCNTNVAPCPVGGRCCVSPGVCQPGSAIIVGSHNSGQNIHVNKFCLGGSAAPPAGCPTGTPTNPGTGEFWYTVPYHTTAVTFGDLCRQAGLTSVIPRTRITRVRASDGVPINGDCGTATADALNLILGESVRIRETKTGGVDFRPAHY